MNRCALITGITGQDGFYLAQQLLADGVEVHGMLRADRESNTQHIDEFNDRLTLHTADLRNQDAIIALIDSVRPTEIYNLAGNSFVPDSWDDPETAADVLGLGVVRLLEAIRIVDPTIRFVQASSSETFGEVDESPQNEQTKLCPRNPYGAAKAYAHWNIVSYRKRYNLFACSAIQYNHESPLRCPRFVTRKITSSVAKIKLGLQESLKLGDLSAQRDWGFAGDFMTAMRLMLQQDRPDDFVIATGKVHSVQQLVQFAFEYVDLDYRDYVQVDSHLIRPKEENILCGDISKAKRVLNWQPSISLCQMIEMMVAADMNQIQANQNKSLEEEPRINTN